MALSVNLKRKDPKFDGDRPTWNIVVSGPGEIFPKGADRFLFLHGLNAMPGDGGFEVWSSPPSIAEPPVYLAAILKEKYRASLKPDTARMLEAAVKERMPADGLERFLGAPAGKNAGDLALSVSAGSKEFVANCSGEHWERRSFLEGAGWLPITNPSDALIKKFGSRPYRTRDPFIAANLEPFMDDAVRKRMGENMAKYRKNIETSKTQKAPEGFSVPSPEGLDYLPFQKTGIQKVVDEGTGAIIADDMGLGKAQPLDAKILTPTGWRLMGDICVGDMVIGSAGKPVRVTGVYPQGEKDIFRVTFSDGAKTECCDEHLWLVNTPTRKNRGSPARVIDLSSIRSNLTDAAGNRKHYIPMVHRVEFAKRDLCIDPYLLGVLLGDGCIGAHYVRFSTLDEELIDEVRSLLPSTLQVKNVSGCDHAIVSSHAGAPNQIRRSLNSIGLEGKGSDDKFIPEPYLYGSSDQRLAILQGLLDTDGYVAKDATIQFSSNSIELARGVAEIVMSLGGNARHTNKISASGKLHHTVTISLPNDIVPFRLSRRLARFSVRQKYSPTRGIASVEPVGRKLAQCISVDAEDHLYVTDDYILTHNTIQGIGILNGRPDVRRALFLCQANMRLKWVREIEKWKINEDLTVGHAEGSTFPDTDIVVINYDIATRHIDTIRGIKWDLIITDEAHNLKNLEAQRTQSILGELDAPDGLPPIPMAPKGQMVHLTGTPKPNRVSELWPLLTSSRPDIWGKGPEARQIFLNRYEPPMLIQRKIPSKYRGGQERTIIVPMAGKPMRELELQMRLRGSGSFIRRLKRDTDLPPKFRTPIEMPFQLSKEDRNLLKEAEADMQEIAARITGRRIVAGESRQAREIIDVISGLPPESPHFSEIARVRKNLGVLKAPHAARFIVDELKDDKELSEDLRRKTVVFAHHKEVIRTISEAAEKEFPGGVLVYDGSVVNSKRQERIDRFMEDPKARLFIMSLAGATGITLTASARMRVVEPDWSPSNMVQIEDRIWRIGQEQACDIGYLFVPGSLDVKMGLSLINKMETDERAINTMSFRGMRINKAKDAEKAAPKVAVAPEPAQNALQPEFRF